MVDRLSWTLIDELIRQLEAYPLPRQPPDHPTWEHPLLGVLPLHRASSRKFRKILRMTAQFAASRRAIRPRELRNLLVRMSKIPPVIVPIDDTDPACVLGRLIGKIEAAIIVVEPRVFGGPEAQLGFDRVRLDLALEALKQAIEQFPISCSGDPWVVNYFAATMLSRLHWV